MRGKRATTHGPAAVAGADVIDGMLEVSRIACCVLSPPICPAAPLPPHNSSCASASVTGRA